MTCGFWNSHEWTKWEVTKEGNLTNQGKVIGVQIFQQRHCSKCGFTQIDAQNKTIYE